MDPVKESFQKVKQDIFSLNQELLFLKKELSETREKITDVCEILIKINEKVEKKVSTQQSQKTTSSTHPSTHDTSFKPLKPLNMPISTGNQGVSTDRQTDRQTDKNTTYSFEIPQKEVLPRTQDSIEDAAKIIDSLDNLKKEIRLKFKRLTEQEVLVFSTIYQLDEEEGHTDYKKIAKRLNLTESSIRDYVGRLIKKGIPVDKKRINNKNISLSISPNLKKIASLSTILKLRDI